MVSVIAYFKTLSTPKIILWCYLIWYLVMAGYHFDPAPGIWMTSIGVSIIIGFALELNSRAAGAPRSWGWPLARLFLFPFCVSSFSALVKDHEFILIFSPAINETGTALGACIAFWLMALAFRRYA